MTSIPYLHTLIRKRRLQCTRTVVAFVFLSAISMSTVAAGLVVLVPTTAGNQLVMRAGPKGEPEAPVLQRATNDAVTKGIALEASRGTTKFMLALDEQAQRIAGVRQPAPTYLLRSQEEGGFARHGFWLGDAKNNLVWHADPYVDLIVDKQSVDDGSFEEIFAHELGHLLLRRLIPRLPNGLSRAAHSSLTITDYPTAFDEGFAIHFQGLARQLTQNEKLTAIDKGLDFKPFLPYWQSNIDRTLRIRGMRDNLFIQQQLPAVLRVGDATSLFDLTHFKNGQQMLASEGVVATLFYHLLIQTPDTPVKLADRYKSLLVSLRALNDQKLAASTPLFLNLVQVHIQRAPDLHTRWITTVLSLTYGATASDAVIRGMTKLSALGQEGTAEEFAVALKQSRTALAALTAQVMRNPQRLGTAVGPELWLAVKAKDGDVATLNLNTAEKTSLTNVLRLDSGDADLLLASRSARGPFADVADFAARRNISPLWRKRLTDAHALAETVGSYQRQ
jgi:DNA uptake protein ComE-like DNA-binding protein